MGAIFVYGTGCLADTRLDVFVFFSYHHQPDAEKRCL